MFEKIIFATDLSPASYSIIPCLGPLQRIGVKQIVLTYALGIKHLDDMRHELLRLAEPELERQRKEIEALGFAVCIRAPRGLPTEEILRVSAEQEAQLIVVGSHGHTLAHDALLGSVPINLLHLSKLPVLVMRLRLSPSGEQPLCGNPDCDLLDHVLYATDFSDNAEVAFQYVKHLARGGTRIITLMHVQDVARIGHATPERLAEFDRIDSERLERRKAELTKLGDAKVDCVIAHGHATAELLKKVNQGISLVVLGSQGRGYFKEVFMGSTSHNLARHAPCPVLVVPMPR